MTARHALIPAAGRGARLDRPGTPKPLVDLGGDPLILRLLRQLERAGIERATIVLGYAGDQIERALTHVPGLKMHLDFVHHPGWEAGLASSVLAGRAHHDKPFVLAMADHLFDDKLIDLISSARPLSDGVIALVDTHTASVFDLDDAVKVRGALAPTDLGRHLPTYDAVDCGLLLATPALFDALVKSGGEDLTDGLNRLARAGKMRGLRVEPETWDDIDTPAALVHAELRLRRARRASVLAGPATGPAVPATHTFTTGAPRETEVVVKRGLVRNPVNAGVIPAESASSPVFVLTDETVNGLYGDAFIEPLRAAGYDVHRLVMADGEESKTLASYTHLAERILGKGIDERSVLISLGGGAVCNVCGLLASTLYRGVGLVHVPTTVMAQCDAAISHKQGVNGNRGKNLIGAYYAPLRIVVDVDVLATLPDPAVPDGLAEVIKHGIAQDAELLNRLLEHRGDIRDPAFLESVIRRNIELKCRVMAIDPQEHHEGMVLQYGHTVGHPVEYLSGYRLSHGQAVAVGMMVAGRVARLLGACDDRVVAVTERVLQQYGLPTRVPDGIRTPDILEGLRFNKRYLTEGTRMALVKAPGELWSVDGEHAIPVSEAVIAAAVDASREVPGRQAVNA
ncbi:MAG: iron-containing alcohol dehydrogenase [Myxococcales bacterium]|nr:iron-containing alcohol dehydrogenase [Myxococcales bacterium]